MSENAIEMNQIFNGRRLTPSPLLQAAMQVLVNPILAGMRVATFSNKTADL